MELKINKYIEQSAIAKKKLSELHLIQISDQEFQRALGLKADLPEDDTYLVALKDYNADEMFELLKNHPFEGDVLEIVFYESILPSTIYGRLDEQTIKQGGEIWRIHKTDKDPFPSIPHGHNLETGIKLNMIDGSLYDPKNKPLNQSISSKNLKAIRLKAGLKD